MCLYITGTGMLHVLRYAAQSPFVSPTKFCAFHNVIFFGSDNIHDLYKGCAEI